MISVQSCVCLDDDLERLWEKILIKSIVGDAMRRSANSDDSMKEFPKSVESEVRIWLWIFFS